MVAPFSTFDKDCFYNFLLSAKICAIQCEAKASLNLQDTNIEVLKLILMFMVLEDGGELVYNYIINLVRTTHHPPFHDFLGSGFLTFVHYLSLYWERNYLRKLKQWFNTIIITLINDIKSCYA